MLTRSLGVSVGIGAAAVLALAGCSSNSDSTPSSSPTQSSSSASPTASPTHTSPTHTASPTATPSNVTKYTVKSGSYANVKGKGAGKYSASGGSMVVTPNGTGALAGKVAVNAKGASGQADWILLLDVDGKGNVTGGSLQSPGFDYKVTGSGGQINYLTTGSGTTLTTTKPIPVQTGTAAPTTMTLNINAAK